MQARRILPSMLFAMAIGATWPLVMRFLGEASLPFASALARFLLRSGLNDRATFLLVHRLVTGAVLVALLGLGFGLLLAFSARGFVFRSWLLFVGAALVSSYLFELFDGPDPWHLSAEWAFPEAWVTVLAIGLVAWLVHRLFLRGFAGSRAAP